MKLGRPTFTTPGFLAIFHLLPGTYYFIAPYAASGTVIFTVTAEGKVDYAPALDPIVSGRGTSTLTVSGFPITIDAMVLGATSFSLNSGANGSAPDARVVTTFHLLPGTHTFNAPSGNVGFVFTVTPSGTVDYDPALDVRVSGTGTTTLRLVSPDTIAPTTAVSMSPGANAAGWNKADVTVTLTATDNSGGSGVQSITYALSGAQTANATIPGSGASILITAEGTTTVTYAARDVAGNVESSKSVTIRLDKTAPTLTAPANQTLEATSPSGAAATFALNATDATSGVASLTGSPASGSTFPLSTNTVTVIATDTAGNASTATFTVTVRDTTPPAIGSVPDITVGATSPLGAMVTFAKPTATDAVDPAPAVTTNPASGSMFPVGSTTVMVTATDASGNKATKSFTVTVLSAAQQTSALVTTVSSIFPQASNLLQNALNSLNGGNTGAACNQVGAFINQLQAQSGKQLTVAQANQLILAATQIRGALGCP